VWRISAFEPTVTTYTFREMVFSDIQRMRPKKPPSWRGVLIAIPAHPGIVASLILRAQQVLVRRGGPWVKLAWWLRTLSNVVTGADLVPGAHVGLGLYLVHPVGVCLGYGARVGDNVTMASGVVLGVRDFSEEGEGYGTTASVGNNVTFGAHAVVLGDVHIGDNAVVGANTVVMADVPDDAVVLGVPARRVGTQAKPADA
jgi:serine O-acetyltransferase